MPGFKTESAIARPEDRALLKRELSRAECLGRTADGKVIYLWQRGGKEDAPALRELGRLREIAFARSAKAAANAAMSTAMMTITCT